MLMTAETRNSYKNRILASLPKAEISRLSPHLSPLTLEIGKTLHGPGEEIAYAYFLESGLASVVVAMADGTRAHRLQTCPTTVRGLSYRLAAPLADFNPASINFFAISSSKLSTATTMFPVC
jgi:hypothetical protein